MQVDKLMVLMLLMVLEMGMASVNSKDLYIKIKVARSWVEIYYLR